jgi:Cut8.
MSINLPSSYVSPSPSPDEMIIQQRGRRRLPVTWSPDVEQTKQNGASARDRTPVKASPMKCSIVLRSTPRKRLLLNDPKELFPTPEKNRKASPNAKKSRLEKTTIYSGPLQASLKGLSQDQLIDVIQQIAERHPEQLNEIQESLPAPDLRPLEDQLNYLKKNIFKSLPNSRLTSKTDSPAYSRAATHVLAFKVRCN